MKLTREQLNTMFPENNGVTCDGANIVVHLEASKLTLCNTTIKQEHIKYPVRLEHIGKIIHHDGEEGIIWDIGISGFVVRYTAGNMIYHHYCSVSNTSFTKDW